MQKGWYNSTANPIGNIKEKLHMLTESFAHVPLSGVSITQHSASRCMQTRLKTCGCVLTHLLRAGALEAALISSHGPGHCAEECQVRPLRWPNTVAVLSRTPSRPHRLTELGQVCGCPPHPHPTLAASHWANSLGVG